MNEHILLNKAFRYSEPATKTIPQDCTFQEKQGYWTKNSTGEVMILSDDPCHLVTKKADIETGEDLKGE
ncbi:conserved protein of unknown function [Methanoculleus bourgensis]|jgi:hypothetical protein|uniref:Uncharacterized protein n=1 Tax=Methanoculleus bourgensis TaxID=83986 RepID=A0A0X3BKM4_9EURY|nr:conserved protein of unknown function [Methanoculleus bourgensis]